MKNKNVGITAMNFWEKVDFWDLLLLLVFV